VSRISGPSEFSPRRGGAAVADSALSVAAGSAVLAARDDDEGLFSRDINGQLVRLDTPTEGDYAKNVTLQIDGQSVTVPLAEPLKDAQGNIVLDLSGKTTPRYTTIYDAALRLYVKQPGDEAKIPIPILCHQPHMTPVAVCRLCVVQVYGQKRGKRAAERKLLPACQHQVKNGMEVFTMNDPGADGERVRQSVKVVAELLAADHLKPAPIPELDAFNELKCLSDRMGLEGSRFALPMLARKPESAPHNPREHAPNWPLDQSSPVFVVDHSACVLCDRCQRACDEVKRNDVIGRTGKGSTAGIAFDLDRPMGDSGCVQCGECMVSCPTSAITFRPVAQVKVASHKGNGHAKSAKHGDAKAEVLHASELIGDPLFAGVPPKFLLWQEGLALRRSVKPGDVLCRQGEPGNTAFLMKRGRLEIVLPAAAGGKETRIEKGPADVILGEMACLSGTPRTADVVALDEGEVWEVRRNVLDRLMRSPAQRTRFESIYRDRALSEVLRGGDLFRGLPEEEYERCVEFLRPRLTFVRVNPGQTVFQQGETAEDFYIVRLGHLKVSIAAPGREEQVLYRGPGTAMGEIGLLALSPDDVGRDAAEVERGIVDALARGPVPAGKRTAACSALDHLELARVGRNDFLEMVRLFPTVRSRLVKMSLDRLRGEGDDRLITRQYVEQGLYQGRSLLVLDLTKCTRCDECVRACIDQHGHASHGMPITRLIREGKRFGDYLVATACRSCKDAYCMIGCPVDAIHRGKHLQIVIEDHCIGCGLCATNCPYGNISMVPNESSALTRRKADASNGSSAATAAQPKASTCDLCDPGGHRDTPMPRCVYACPHDAAHRMPGDQLLKKVLGV
jgi:Fe-S-cluster-containing hydrogenase component 2/CRP-like cAMP-binding protein